MKVIDVIEEAAVLLQLEDVLNLPEFAESEFRVENPKIVANETSQKNLKTLLKCVNLAAYLIATNYIAHKKVEKVTSVNGEIKFKDLNFDVIQILKVHGRDGEINFKVFPTFIDCFKGGTYEVLYCYVPRVKELTDVVSEFSEMLKVETLAFLVASNFCAISALVEEASFWENKFKNSINSKVRVKEHQIKERRWF